MQAWFFLPVRMHAAIRARNGSANFGAVQARDYQARAGLHGYAEAWESQPLALARYRSKSPHRARNKHAPSSRSGMCGHLSELVACLQWEAQSNRGFPHVCYAVK